MRILAAAVLIGGMSFAAVPARTQNGIPADYAWLAAAPSRILADSFAPPTGFDRVVVPRGSFGHWLRGLPLKADGAQVVLFDGRARRDQTGAAAIVDIDVGTRDLQQCADAVMRLRAEWAYAARRFGALAFNFTSGDRYGFDEWIAGRTATVSGNRVNWVAGPRRTGDHASLRQWLDLVFTYAGSLSLQRELTPVADVATVQPGDVLIQGGSPGHAVIVLDVARDANRQPAVLLAQSFMPAQSIHVLRNPQGGAWFVLKPGQPIATPDWRFMPTDLRRFAD